jgi:hypothetical protein
MVAAAPSIVAAGIGGENMAAAAASKRTGR